jgi:hypothetical protein
MYTRSEYEKKYSNYLWSLSEHISKTTNSHVTVSQEAVQHLSARLERCNEELQYLLISDRLASVEPDYQFKLSFGCPYCSYQFFGAELDVLSWKGRQVGTDLVEIISRCGLLPTTAASFKMGIGYHLCVYLGECPESDPENIKLSHSSNSGRPEAHGIVGLLSLLLSDIEVLRSILSTLTDLSTALDVPIRTLLLKFESHVKSNSVDTTGMNEFAEWAIKSFGK